MNIITLTVFILSSITGAPAKFLFSHKKDIGTRIEVHLINKNWYPRDFDPPRQDKVIEEWDGSVSQAFKILSNKVRPVYNSQSFFLKDAAALFTEKEYGYDPSLPSIMVMQTMFSGVDSFFSKNVIKALAMRNIVKNYNVFNLRFPNMQLSIKRTVVEVYLGFHGNYPYVGEAVAAFFSEGIKNKLITADQINLIGYSYSGQLAGYIARYITQHTGGKIKSILAADPYALGDWNRGTTHVSHTDAEIVHLVHTNNFMWGSLHNMGTADFIINNGNIQPGCLKNPFDLSCSHARAAPFLWFMILFKSKFQAMPCTSYWNFWRCKCEENTPETLSYPLNERSKGTLYMKTSKTYPFGIGKQGVNCKAKPKDEKFSKEK